MEINGVGMPTVKHAFSYLNQFIEPVSKEYGISKLWLYFDYFYSLVTTGCTIKEYFIFNFFLCNRRGKNRFFTLLQRAKYEKKNNLPADEAKAMDKEESLALFHDYISRDWCGRKYHNTSEEYEEFAKAHTRAILKPLDQMGGAGVRIVDIKVLGGGYALYELCKRENLIVEQLIEQHEELSAVYPHAINTLRMLTKNCKCVGAAFRIGAGGGEIDNAHAGGIFAEVDVETGIVVSKAIRYNRESYIRHPDTGIVILGREMPFWKECVDLVEKAAARLPGVSLIGWDIAITPDGPTVVEVNNMPGLELIQAPAGHGIKEIIER